MRVHFIQHVSFENPGILLKWARVEQHSISFTEIFSTIVFPDPSGFDLLIILGGPMGVYEEEKFPWLKEEKQFIRETIAAGKKVLGICLGSQLLAEVLGAPVYPNKEKEIGWWPLQKIKSEQGQSLMAELPDLFTSFHWHGDTFDLPPGAVHLFATDICPNQGFLYKNKIAALQFHPEADEALIAAMIKHEKEELIKAPFIQSEETINQETRGFVQQQEKWIFSFVQEFLAL